MGSKKQLNNAERKLVVVKTEEGLSFQAIAGKFLYKCVVKVWILEYLGV